MMDKVLVTGATGLLGSSVVRELINRQRAVRVLVRPSRDATAQRPELAGLNVEIVSGDLSEPATLEQAMDGCSAVIHSAAMIHIGYQRLEEARQVNVASTAAIAAACRRGGQRMIYVSTVDTLPAARSADQPISEESQGLAKVACTYVISKTEAEAQVTQACSKGLDAIVVHPGFMLGPYDWKPSSGVLLLAVHKAPTVVAPRGTASVCDARDVAAAIVNSLTAGRSGQHYILAGENISYPELCRQLVAVMGQSKRVFRMGPVIPAAARMADMWYRISGMPERLFNSAAIDMGRLHHAYDSTKAQRELAYTCRPLNETLVDAWLWVRDHFIEAR